jgi:cupin domain
MTAAPTAEEIRVGAFVIRFLVEADATAGSAALFEFDVPAGGPMPPPHSHDRYEETIYGLRGTTTWTVDGVTTEIGIDHLRADVPREPCKTTLVAGHDRASCQTSVLGQHARLTAACFDRLDVGAHHDAESGHIDREESHEASVAAKLRSSFQAGPRASDDANIRPSPFSAAPGNSTCAAWM